MRDGTPPRKERILNELKDVMRDLGGFEPDKIDVQATFLQLGVDSLFLAQASTAFKKRFGVKIVFRQLLEEAPSLDTLAGYIDAQLPPDKPPVSTPRPVETVLSTSSPVQTRPQLPDSPSVVPNPMEKLEAHEVSTSSLSLERIISQQVQVMAAQLEMLRHCEVRSPSLPPPVAVFTEPSNSHSGESSGNGATTVENRAGAWTSASNEERKSVGDAKRFGPWKPIDRSSVQNMEARQKRHLDDLISRYTARTRRSKELTQRHRPHLADPRAVAGFRTAWKEMVYPIVVERSSGSKLWDIDGNEYIDLTMGFGSILLGHSPGFVTQALRAQIEKGIEIGPQSPLAGEVARLVTELTGMERVTYCNTGSEAVLAALRVARTVSGRNKIALFTGSYHGILDEVLVRAANTRGKHHAMPVAPGIPSHMVEHVVLLEYGNPESIEVLKDHAEDLAAVLVEPVQSRHPDLQPREFLHALRQWTKKAGVALIFDEVITGFRLHPGGAQAWFGIQADLATYGKILGGGMPIGLLAGKADFMDALDGGMWNYGDGSLPEAVVTYFAGTFVRHPLALAAAAAVLNHLKEQGPELQERLNERASRLAGDLNGYFIKTGVPIHLENCASMFHFSFLDESPFASLFFFHLREKGLHIWEGRPISISTAHTDDDLAFISRVVKESARELQEAGFFPGSLADPITRGDPVSEETPVVWSGATGSREGFTNGSSRTVATTQKEAAFGEYPLTESQMEIWLATRFGDSASQAFNENILLKLKGKLDANGMRWAIQQVVDRHDALRTTFSPDGDCQRVAPSLPVEIPYHDLSHLDSKRRERELATLLTGKFQQPFDLVKGPLVRARILKLKAEEHLLLLTAHHIVCDGWSIHVILQDLSSLYSAACRGVQADLPVAMQFGEYALWQRRQQQSPEGRETERFWLDQFSGPIPVLELPTDRPRPPFQTFRGSQQRICIDDSISAGIKRLGASKGCTAFTTFLAAFKVLLYRLTAQEDIVVGIGMAGQSLAGNNILVGHCINTLPLRSRIDGNQSFIKALQSLHNLLLDAYEHSNYTFGSLLKKLNTPRDASRTPLMSAMFNVDQELHGVRFGDLEIELCPDPNPYYNFDLLFNIFEKRGRLILECEYNADLFDPETIRRWITYYQTLLEGIVADPAQRLSELPLLTEAERHQLLVEWNDTKRNYSQDNCFHQLFEAQVQRTPDAAAVVFDGKELSYRELNARANRLAHYLRKSGVGPEVLVGLCVDRSLEMIVGMVGILKAGGAYVPLDPIYPKERLGFMLEDARISVLVTERRLNEELGREGMRIINLDEESKAIGVESEENPPQRTTADHLAYVIYTSGSTGRPKGVLITHRNLVHSTSARFSYYSEPVTSFLLIPSFAFDSSVAGIFWTLCQGGTLVLLEQGASYDAPQIVALIAARGITHLLCLPSLYAL
jgi:glutamate-1-semialdehyde aminotransferase/non-ribosomal peptide synthetase component F/acyl carrier protein